MDYRESIKAISRMYAQPGEDLDRALLDGAPEIVSAEEALSIAAWLEDEANDVWGMDPRHAAMAADIRRMVRR